MRPLRDRRTRQEGHVIICSELAGLALCFVLASPNPAIEPPDPELQRAVQARQAALRTGDAEEWGKYTTDDFLLVFINGSVTTKRKRMSMMAGRPAPVAPRSDERWRMYGTAAILTAEELIGGKPARLTAVWVRQEGVWKAATVVFTAVSQP
jgi:hypothetical protein